MNALDISPAKAKSHRVHTKGMIELSDMNRGVDNAIEGISKQTWSYTTA